MAGVRAGVASCVAASHIGSSSVTSANTVMHDQNNELFIIFVTLFYACMIIAACNIIIVWP